jgi:hypothetical protein
MNTQTLKLTQNIGTDDKRKLGIPADKGKDGDVVDVSDEAAQVLLRNKWATMEQGEQAPRGAQPGEPMDPEAVALQANTKGAQHQRDVTTAAAAGVRPPGANTVGANTTAPEDQFAQVHQDQEAAAKQSQQRDAQHPAGNQPPPAQVPVGDTSHQPRGGKNK